MDNLGDRQRADHRRNRLDFETVGGHDHRLRLSTIAPSGYVWSAWTRSGLKRAVIRDARRRRAIWNR